MQGVEQRHREEGAAQCRGAHRTDRLLGAVPGEKHQRRDDDGEDFHQRMRREESRQGDVELVGRHGLPGEQRQAGNDQQCTDLFLAV